MSAPNYTWAVYPLLRRNQNGLTRRRSTTFQILSIGRMLEEMWRFNGEVTLCFVDFGKVVDSFSRKAMFEILPMYGKPQSITEAIKCIHQHYCPGHNSRWRNYICFDIKAGVLHLEHLLLSYSFVVFFCLFLLCFFMHFCPGAMTTHAESINSDLQRGLERRLRHTQHWTQNRTSCSVRRRASFLTRQYERKMRYI